MCLYYLLSNNMTSSDTRVKWNSSYGKSWWNEVFTILGIVKLLFEILNGVSVFESSTQSVVFILFYDPRTDDTCSCYGRLIPLKV